MKRLLIIGISLFIGVLQSSNQSFSEAMLWRKESEKAPFYASTSWKKGLESFKQGLKERWDVFLSIPRTCKILSQNPSIEAYYAHKKEKYRKQEDRFMNEITGEEVAGDIRAGIEIGVQIIKSNFSNKEGLIKSAVKLPLGVEEKIKDLAHANKLPIVIETEEFLLLATLQGMMKLGIPIRVSGVNEIIIQPSFLEFNEEEQKFSIAHEFEHLANQDHIKTMAIINYEVFKKIGRYIHDLRSEEILEIVPKIQAPFESQLLTWELWQEKRADKLAASKDMESAKVASKLFERLPQNDCPYVPHPKNIQRSAYLAKIYNLLKAEEMIKATTNRILNTEPF
jgi:hypothetical protein